MRKFHYNVNRFMAKWLIMKKRVVLNGSTAIPECMNQKESTPQMASSCHLSIITWRYATESSASVAWKVRVLPSSIHCFSVLPIIPSVFQSGSEKLRLFPVAFNGFLV